MSFEPDGARTRSLVERVSPLAFDATVDRLVEAIERAGLVVFARIDHAKAAQAAGMHMPSTLVLLYGNPKGGTPVMLASPAAALELPLRVLVRVGTAGKTLVAYEPVVAALARYGVPQALARTLEPAQAIVDAAFATAEGQG
jgi:uncharacterized protein (DUF302 family)